MKSEQQSLMRFRESKSEADFRRIVDAQLGFVLSVAYRVLNNRDLAQDVAQEVFTRLALGPDKVPKGLPLAVWLHRTTRSLAIDFIRAEECRRRYEEVAHQLNAMKEPDMDWSQISPVIDQALDELRTEDRVAVVLRFFKNQSHSQIGAVLGIDSDAARMRVGRALKKLRFSLRKKGVVVSAAALAASLPAHASLSVPPGLATAVCSTALASTGSATVPLSLTLLTTAMNLKKIAVSVAGVILLSVAAWQRYEISEVKATSGIVQLEPKSAKSSSRSSRGRSGLVASGSQSRRLVLEAEKIAALEPAQLREAALRKWLTQFNTGEEIQEFGAMLKEDDQLTPLLRTRISELLAAHWAAVDFDGAMDAHIEAFLKFESSPFGQVLPTKLGDGLALTWIAEVDPTRFRKALTKEPGLLRDLLTGERDSGLAQSLLDGSKGPNSALVDARTVTERQGLSTALARTAPFEVLEVLVSLETHFHRRVLLDRAVLGTALLNEHDDVGLVWNRIKALGPITGDQIDFNGIASAIAQNDPRPTTTLLEELKEGEPSWVTLSQINHIATRLLEESEQLRLSGGEDGGFWEKVSDYGDILNAYPESLDVPYADGYAYQTMSRLAAQEDTEAALAWAGKMTRSRLKRIGTLLLSSRGYEGVTLSESWSQERYAHRAEIVRVAADGEATVGTGVFLDSLSNTEASPGEIANALDEKLQVLPQEQLESFRSASTAEPMPRYSWSEQDLFHFELYAEAQNRF